MNRDRKKDVRAGDRRKPAGIPAEDRYRALFEHACDSVYLVDAKTGAILDFNKEAYQSLGYTSAEFRGLSVFDLVIGRKPAQIKAHIRAIVRKGIDVFYAQHRTKQGAVMDVRMNARAIVIGDKPYIEATAHDITEERRAQTALKDSEEKFRNLAERSPNMIFINQGGRVVYANTKCEEVMGYSRRELCSPDFNFMTLVAPEYHASTREHFQKHMRGEHVPSYEYVVVTKSGARIPAVISTALIPYGGTRAILGIVTDVSQLQHAQAGLREAAAKLREQKKALEEKNAALKEILARIETEKLEIRRQVTANVEKLLLPIVLKLKRGATSPDTRQLQVLESNLQDLTSRFGAHISAGAAALSARETEITAMIRSGLTSKEIAQTLQLSLRTVDTYRNRIRKKLGISNKRINLSSHLQSLG